MLSLAGAPARVCEAVASGPLELALRTCIISFCVRMSVRFERGVASCELSLTSVRLTGTLSYRHLSK